MAPYLMCHNITAPSSFLHGLLHPATYHSTMQETFELSKGLISNRTVASTYKTELHI